MIEQYSEMTDAQREIVESYHFLIYNLIDELDLEEDERDDYYDALAIGLCNAAIMYDEEDDDFVNLATRIMLEEALNYAYEKCEFEENPCLSIEELLERYEIYSSEYDVYYN